MGAPLTLEYPDKYRLWAELIQGNTDRLFVATEEALKLGSKVPLRLSLTTAALHLVVEAAVIGRRGASARFKAGVYLRLGDAQVEKCRRFLGLSQAPERYEQGRKAPRVRCELPVQLTEPSTAQPGVVKNLSETGMLLVSPVTLVAGQEVKGVLSLEPGRGIRFEAEVSWARNDKRLVGFQFTSLDADARGELSRALERLAQAATESAAPTLVVADDDPDILDFLTKALTKHGYDVRKARRGEEALDLIRELRPQLVILDILMPGIDGVDICRMMRADVEMADIPVLFLSALDSERLHDVADEAGATDYLAKPVNLADLINLVGRYLRTSNVEG